MRLNLQVATRSFVCLFRYKLICRKDIDSYRLQIASYRQLSMACQILYERPCRGGKAISGREMCVKLAKMQDNKQ